MSGVFDDGFGGVFGDAVFGDTVFGDLGPLVGGATPARRGGLIGGSGFPANWIDRMNAPTAALDLDERELEEILALNLL